MCQIRHFPDPLVCQIRQVLLYNKLQDDQSLNLGLKWLILLKYLYENMIGYYIYRYDSLDMISII
jgi:hypothetical protein